MNKLELAIFSVNDFYKCFKENPTAENLGIMLDAVNDLNEVVKEKFEELERVEECLEL